MLSANIATSVAYPAHDGHSWAMTSATTPRLITIGETMALVAPAAPVSLTDTVDFRVEAGGAESNVASHIVGLGESAAWVSAVGDDALGRRILTTIHD